MGEGTGVPKELFDEIREEGVPGFDAESLDRVLRGYFSGKRDSVRSCKFLPIQVKGNYGTFQAMAVDVSMSGALLRITDPQFTEDEDTRLMPYTEKVWHHFQGGFQVDLAGGIIELEADVVRVTGFAGRGSDIVLIGCKFRRPLTAMECGALGIEHGTDRPPGE